MSQAPAIEPAKTLAQELEAVRLELASALDRVNDVLKSTARNGNHSDAAVKTGKVPV